MSFELNFTREFRNPLLQRREISFEVHHRQAPTPTKAQIREMVAKKIGVNPNLVYPIKLTTRKNSWKAVGVVHVYDSEERARALLPKYLALRLLPTEEREKLKTKAKGSKSKG